MNQYGKLAYQHWARWRPNEMSQISNPQEHFRRMGSQIEQRIVDLANETQGEDRTDEGYLAKLGRLNMTRLVAEEQVLREVLPAPEQGHPHAEDFDPEESLTVMGVPSPWQDAAGEATTR